MDISHWSDLCCIHDECPHLFNVERCAGGQQMPQRISDGILTFVSGQLQDLDVDLVSDLFSMSSSERVVGDAEGAGRKHLFTVLIIREGTRLADQRIDDVSVIDRCLLFAEQPGHRLHNVVLMQDGDLVSPDPHVDELTNQPAGNRIGVRPHSNGTALSDASIRQQIVGIESFMRQSAQVCLFFDKSL